MHIVYISQEFPPSKRAGGIASYVKEIADGMIRLGHQVTIVTASDDTRISSDTTEDGIRVLRLSGGAFFVPSAEGGSKMKKLRVIYRFHSYRRKVLEAAKALKDIDIIEVADYGAEGIYLNKMNVPVILRLHTPSLLDRGTFGKVKVPLWALHRSIAVKAEEVVLESAKYVSSCSQSLLDWMKENVSFSPRRLTVIRNPIAFFHNKFTESNTKKSKDGFTVFYAGTITGTKGVYELYKACEQLNREGMNITLKLAGKQGSYAENLKEEVSKADNKWCQFLGNLTRNDLYTYYSSADVCCFPSWWENMPMVCLEAMSCGAIVVGSTSGGMKEIIEDGINGFLTMPRNPDELAGKLRTALSMEKSVTMKMRQAAQMTIKESFCTDVIATKMEAFYNEVIRDFKTMETKL